MSDVRIMVVDKAYDDADVVELWWLAGAKRDYYPTKMEAEKAARQLFPDEPICQREARVRYKNFICMEGL